VSVPVVFQPRCQGPQGEKGLSESCSTTNQASTTSYTSREKTGM